MFRFLLLSLIFISTLGKAQTIVADTNFRNYLNQNYASCLNKNKEIVDSLAAKVSGTMDCSGRKIASLAGIEKFYNLTGLNCATNKLTSIDQVKSLSKLTYFDCYNNSLTSLPDFSKLTNLVYFKCAGNHIQLLPDLSKNILINHLDCFDNIITAMPGLDRLTNLVELNIYNNKIDSLPDLSKLTQLSIFQCYSNKLKTIPGLQNLVALTSFIAGDNPLQNTPDFTKLTKMQRLMLWNTRLQTPPLTLSMPDLDYLDLNANKLTTTPDLSKNLKLTKLYFVNNAVDTIRGLKNLSILRELKITDNRISNLSELVSSQNTLVELIADSNLLTRIENIKNFKMLQKVNLAYNKFTFEQLLPLLSLPNYQDSTILYAPQALLPIPAQVTAVEKNSFSYSLGIDKAINSSSYVWKKNGSSYSAGKSDSLKISIASLGDSGAYTCSITNVNLPKLTLSTSVMHLSIQPCIDLRNLTYSKENIECEKAGKVIIHTGSIAGGKLPFQFKLTSLVLGKISMNETGVFDGLKERKYQLTVSDQTGCLAIAPVSLEGKSMDECNHKIIIVNGPGALGELLLEQPGFAKIFDKSGKEVHSFPTPGSWDGTIAKGELPPGVYLVEHNGLTFSLTLMK